MYAALRLPASMRSAPLLSSYAGANPGSWPSYLPISHAFGVPCPPGPTRAKTSLCTSLDTPLWWVIAQRTVVRTRALRTGVASCACVPPSLWNDGESSQWRGLAPAQQSTCCVGAIPVLTAMQPARSPLVPRPPAEYRLDGRGPGHHTTAVRHRIPHGHLRQGGVYHGKRGRILG